MFERLCGLVVRVPGYRSWGSGFDYRRHHIFWEVVVLERDSLSLVRITEELFQGNSGSDLEINGPVEFVALTTRHPHPLKLALSSPTSGGRSVGMFHLRTQATEFVVLHVLL
jgi:hypothetical protein